MLNTIVYWIGIILVLVAGCPVKCGERIFYLNNVSYFKSEGAPSFVTNNNNFLLFSKVMPFEIKKNKNKMNKFQPFFWYFRHWNFDLQLIKNKYVTFKCNLSIFDTFRNECLALNIKQCSPVNNVVNIMPELFYIFIYFLSLIVGKQFWLKCYIKQMHRLASI